MHAVATGDAAITTGAETLPSVETTAATAQAGGLAPGQILDPSTSGYGVTL